MNEVKYPEVEVGLTGLTGQDGNGFMVIGAVCRALRDAGVSSEEIEEFSTKAMSGDYDHLLSTCMKWVTVY